MKRKLIKQGVGGFVVTLPVDWVRENKLGPGDEVNITHTDEGLLLTAAEGVTERSVAIDVSPYEKRMILNLLNQSYRLGYDKIDITFKTKEQFECIRDTTKDVLLGFEVVSCKGNNCVIQNIAEPDSGKFEIILRKIFLQTMELSAEVTLEVSNMNRSKLNLNLEYMKEQKMQIDKLTNYTRRTVLSKRYGGSKSALLYSIINNLSLVSHSYYYLHQYLSSKANKKDKIDEKTIKLLNSTNAMFSEFYDAFYKKDIDALAKIGVDKIRSSEESDRLLENSKGTNSIVIFYAKEMIRLIHMSSTFAIGYII
jgi:phosphate uptake regulator